jgi:hypothetical protein
MTRGFLGSELTASEVCCKRLASAGKVLDAGTTARFVDLWRCCTDADDSAGYAFSSNNVGTKRDFVCDGLGYNVASRPSHVGLQ